MTKQMPKELKMILQYISTRSVDGTETHVVRLG